VYATISSRERRPFVEEILQHVGEPLARGRPLVAGSGRPNMLFANSPTRP
jgi:hypothetical protein